MVISEIRTRGTGGGADEFVELFNATAAPVVLDTNWKIEARATTASSYSVRWTGVGKSIPAWGHYLIVGTNYTQSPAGDDNLSNGISDANSVRLVHGTGTVDAVCFYYDTTTQKAYTGSGFTCQGTPVSNLPHNDGTSTASNSDVSIERAPGGAAGNCTDTGDNASDFISSKPATPQNTASPPTP